MTTNALFPRACLAVGIPAPIAEYRFAPPRRWRWDFALPEYKLALEVQGGTFVGGRHSRGPALRKEHEKLNAAAILGWRVLYVFPETLLRDGPGLLKEALQP